MQIIEWILDSHAIQHFAKAKSHLKTLTAQAAAAARHSVGLQRKSLLHSQWNMLGRHDHWPADWHCGQAVACSATQATLTTAPLAYQVMQMTSTV